MASVIRSTVESKKAPRWLEVPDALASAPSNRSGRAAAITRIKPMTRRPAATATAANAATTRPTTVRWSGESPVRRRARPIGRTARSTGPRKAPSSISSTPLPAPHPRRAPPSSSTLSSARCSTTRPSTASTSTKPSAPRRLFRRVGEDAPRRPAEEAAPHLLSGGVAHREAKCLLGADERLSLVEMHARSGEHTVETEQDETRAADREAVVDERGLGCHRDTTAPLQSERR